MPVCEIEPLRLVSLTNTRDPPLPAHPPTRFYYKESDLAPYGFPSAVHGSSDRDSPAANTPVCFGRCCVCNNAMLINGARLRTNRLSKDTLPLPHVLPLTIPSMLFSFKARLRYQEIPPRTRCWLRRSAGGSWGEVWVGGWGSISLLYL